MRQYLNNTLKILFEDSHILVLDKPPGMVVDKSATQTEGTVENWLEENYPSNLPRMGIVHRLDKDTSGLLLVAKDSAALENLQTQFQQRIVKKQYLALVHGSVTEPGRVEGAIGRNPGDREKFTVLENGGKEAVTEYKPLKSLQFTVDSLQKIFPDFNKIQMRKLPTTNYQLFTLVACQPLTGRTHQIRVHLKYIGHPIVADEKYAGRKMYRLDHRWCPRQFLHAAKIGFNHPMSGEWMEFESPLPEDLKKVLETLNG